MWLKLTSNEHVSSVSNSNIGANPGHGYESHGVAGTGGKLQRLFKNNVVLRDMKCLFSNILVPGDSRVINMADRGKLINM